MLAAITLTADAFTQMLNASSWPADLTGTTDSEAETARSNDAPAQNHLSSAIQELSRQQRPWSQLQSHHSELTGCD